MSTRVLTAHIPEELAEKVDRYAESMERSRAWIVKQALSNWVEWEEEKLRRTLEGLADVDAGRLIDHEDMVAWANSLGTDKPLPPPLPRKR
ncbi:MULTISPECIES: ribbon-helix-helix protein, CopG family [unclassified Devosia]|uniref:CopG family ribbon-helix-helix protein n=1 Tax=unclassified Devosia TaxID=196773 RepID=UPI00086F2F90|nr:MULTISPECIES: ribbon-helix-helix protein, CopG family [unclassified Devosia]MBN9361304.1 ribbon-helix-helix protein, CopG family [Devosia sp.]ODS94832.1 MAG: CopG family transcriptional regulator [Devosia sp. SCN 66-27]OJX26389.1 MAG: CopG family transcriptional regulator [Devosia sp. 66-14]